MYEVTGRLLPNISFTAEGHPLVTLEINERAFALSMVDDLSLTKKLSIKIGKYKVQRSLSANAYFHLLVNKIASKLKISDDEAKKKLVTRYGVIEKDEDGKVFGAMLPAEADINLFYPYARSYKHMTIDGKEYTCYLFYKRTRDMDTSEMARLIDGTISEAKDLGIQTDTPEQIERMKALWKES